MSEILTRWQDPTIKELQDQLQQKENIIKEVREIVRHEKEDLDKFKGVDLVINTYQQVFGVMLSILDKENK